MRRARALGATSLATGHYARIVTLPDGQKALLRARDRQKDQSYFLFNMPADALPMVRFPLGELTKEEVRGHARRLGLPNADKSDSQEICFVPDGDYAAFVERARPGAHKPGHIVDQSGRVVGEHQGVHHFTIGQRRGLRVAALEPRYVVAVDAARAEVTIGGVEALGKKSIVVKDATWPTGAPAAPTRMRVQIRYRHAAMPATVTALSPDQAEVVFDEPERGPAAGQAAVFYAGDGERVLGGGFIS